MRKCPKCQSDNIHRSRPRTIWEWLRKKITHKRSYRCHACEWRGWGADRGPTFGEGELAAAARAVAATAPHVGDAGARPAGRRAEINLDELDALDPLGPRRI